MVNSYKAMHCVSNYEKSSEQKQKKQKKETAMQDAQHRYTNYMLHVFICSLSPSISFSLTHLQLARSIEKSSNRVQVKIETKNKL